MKKIIALSATAAFLSTAVYANDDLQSQIDKLNKQVNYLQKKVSSVNAQAANDNIKFDVDFRTAVDKIEYESVNGNKYKNTNLYSNRLWLNMGYAPTDDMVFKGQLSYYKAFGASYGQRGTGFGFDTFDWISSETLNDDKVRVREAYWLWMPTFGDARVTASIGRRPSTNGYLANLREDDKKPKSPLGHVINMEFDGASAGVTLDKVLPGFMVKLCLGRGLTNATGWASNATSRITPTGFNSFTGGSTQPNYTEDGNNLDTVDLYGFIFVPYDDGQYAVKTTWYRGKNVPGLILSDYSAGADATMNTADDVQTWSMQNTGDMDGMAVSFKVDGIGNEISDFLDETTFFASYAMSKSHPASVNRTATATMVAQGMGITGSMLGSNKSETGHSYWLGVNMPNLTGGRFGLEYNHGDEHWKSFTYGEDTMSGSKLATRGNAIEAYWTQPLIDNVFSMQVRYTQMNYDYSGSNGFFGDGSLSYKVDSIMGKMMDEIETAQDLRVYFRYRY
ncbi:DUF3373 domain-containing protein [Sulfurimonas lithotrophica]|uniref:DUF3373 domain-containing protein n=1 Tax=Sulfurimonas lithotrophica TaxID=2590022 RepID=A0A5P8NXS4_9BACT|nr:DUF3373 family protein [Sulfurimonas lithotrophica]QFR48214.1 DUF3373 domain-containing protein [Sulfurimonas lithotrophica]